MRALPCGFVYAQPPSFCPLAFILSNVPSCRSFFIASKSDGASEEYSHHSEQFNLQTQLICRQVFLAPGGMIPTGAIMILHPERSRKTNRFWTSCSNSGGPANRFGFIWSKFLYLQVGNPESTQNDHHPQKNKYSTIKNMEENKHLQLGISNHSPDASSEPDSASEPFGE